MSIFHLHSLKGNTITLTMRSSEIGGSRQRINSEGETGLPIHGADRKRKSSDSGFDDSSAVKVTKKEKTSRKRKTSICNEETDASSTKQVY